MSFVQMLVLWSMMSLTQDYRVVAATVTAVCPVEGATHRHLGIPTRIVSLLYQVFPDPAGMTSLTEREGIGGN